ncbi:COG complex component, COG2, C-terminal [Dillenia turbinata]|uniref:Conserved oligomeric Golgi complex subunit 2 n=1 Tax=Dillenia turbinata TaxID=194707 RepID=A0AAN8UWR3_9MAGN
MVDLMAPPRSPTDLFGDPIDSRPLWFRPSSVDFHSESYISDLRTFVPLNNLRSELQSHLSSLKHELIELINRDYADFVNLSTKLIDVDGAIIRMRAPLTELREKIESFRASVENSLVALQSGLKQRAEASAAREVLELLLDTSHVVSKVEKLIKELPTVPADWSNADSNNMEKGNLTNGTLQQHETGTSLRETQSMLLERVAIQNLPFVENMEKRIQSATLLYWIRVCNIVLWMAWNTGMKMLFVIANSAEEIFGTTVVVPLIQNVIPDGPSLGVVATSGDELGKDYQQIKQIIEKDCSFLLEIVSAENSGLHVFDFLANSILKGVLLAIQKGKPGVFSPGRPAEFLRNYKASLDFLSYLEGYCPTRTAVAKFRAEPVYLEFMKQWNIGVYFSLRFQEIAAALDSALTGGLVPIQNSDSDLENSKDLTLKQSVALFESLRSCRSKDVLVLSCSDKFFCLSLQLLSRYSNWLPSGLAARKSVTTSPQPGSEWAISAAPDDFVYILASCSFEVLESIKESILQSEKWLKDLLPLVINNIVETLVEKSVKDLRQLKGIITIYRMTNKPLLVRHSPYVSGVLRPLKYFREGERVATYLTRETRSELLLHAATEITGCYNELAADLVNLEYAATLLRLESRQRRFPLTVPCGSVLHLRIGIM